MGDIGSQEPRDHVKSKNKEYNIVYFPENFSDCLKIINDQDCNLNDKISSKVKIKENNEKNSMQKKNAVNKVVDKNKYKNKKQKIDVNSKHIKSKLVSNVSCNHNWNDYDVMRSRWTTIKSELLKSSHTQIYTNKLSISNIGESYMYTSNDISNGLQKQLFWPLTLYIEKNDNIDIQYPETYFMTLNPKLSTFTKKSFPSLTCSKLKNKSMTLVSNKNTNSIFTGSNFFPNVSNTIDIER